MNKYVWILCALGVIASGCVPKINPEQEKASLLAADRAWSQTTTDVEKFMAFFAPDAALYPQGMPIAEGRDAIRQVMNGFMAMPGFVLSWEPVNAEVAATADLGYTAGAYTLTTNDAAGTPMTEKGKYVTVWKKQADGQWKVARDIFNADAPPPPPPPSTPVKKKK